MFWFLKRCVWVYVLSDEWVRACISRTMPLCFPCPLLNSLCVYVCVCVSFAVLILTDTQVIHFHYTWPEKKKKGSITDNSVLAQTLPTAGASFYQMVNRLTSVLPYHALKTKSETETREEQSAPLHSLVHYWTKLSRLNLLYFKGPPFLLHFCFQPPSLLFSIPLFPPSALTDRKCERS